MLKKIIALFCVLTMTAVSASAAVFSDISGHWAESEIQYGYENNFINGYADGLFRPNEQITRAEFTKMLVASVCQNFDFDTSELADDTHWAAEYYNFAVMSGMWSPDYTLSYDGISPEVMEGESFDYPIKRWEMAYMLCDFLANVFSSFPEPSEYTDSAETKELYGEEIAYAVAACMTEGLLTGDENGNFNAAKNGTRAEALTVVNRVDRMTKRVLQEIAEMTDSAEALVNEKVKTYEEIPTGHPQVKVETEDGKSFTIELYPEYAPQTAANFLELAESGFYDGLKFHRVVEGFVAQGGDPNGDGTGGAEHNIFGEFLANGFEDNTLSHERGVVSMARGQFNNSASSQFFICYDDASYLDGQYAAFGKVIEGMENVDSFCDGELGVNSLGEQSVPETDIVIKSMTVMK